MLPDRIKESVIEPEDARAVAAVLRAGNPTAAPISIEAALKLSLPTVQRVRELETVPDADDAEVGHLSQ